MPCPDCPDSTPIACTPSALTEDERRDYGEPRIRVFALLDGRLHIAVVTPREDALRVISFRRANRKEARIYAQFQKTRSRTP